MESKVAEKDSKEVGSTDLPASSGPAHLRRDNESLDDFEHLEHENSAGKTFDSTEASFKSSGLSEGYESVDKVGGKTSAMDFDISGEEVKNLESRDQRSDEALPDRLSSSKLFDNYENTEPVDKKSPPRHEKMDQENEFQVHDFDPFSKFAESQGDKKSDSVAFMEAERGDHTFVHPADSGDETHPKTTDYDSHIKPASDDGDKLPKPEPVSSKVPEPEPVSSSTNKDETEDEEAESEDIDEKLKLAGINVDPEVIQQDIKPIPSAPQPDPELTPAVPLSSYPSTPLEPVPESSILPGFPPAAPQKGDESRTSEVNGTDREQSGMVDYIRLGSWFNPNKLHPKVVELVYWRDPKKSGIVFGSVLGILLSLTYFSLISVVAYLSLALLTGTICFRVYKNILQAVQKTSDGHPFKDFLEMDLNLPQDKVREVTDTIVSHVNAALVELRRLFLVEDLVDSIKFGVLLWCLTYLGAWFNGMTLVIIAFVALFTLPKVYENNKAQIDQNLELARSKIAEISSKVKAAIPIGKKPEEKKDQ